MGSNTIENKEKRTLYIHVCLRLLFDLCEFDFGRVNCIIFNMKTYLDVFTFLLKAHFQGIIKGIGQWFSNSGPPSLSIRPARLCCLFLFLIIFM